MRLLDLRIDVILQHLKKEFLNDMELLLELLEQQVQQSKYADQIISSALELLKSKFSKEKQKVTVVYQHAEKLLNVSDSKLRALVVSLDGQLRALTPPSHPKYQARSNSANNSSPNRNYFQKQIVEAANHSDYYANFEQHRSWVRMTLKTEQEFDYVISFHGYGPGDTGILVASAFTYVKVPREDGGSEPVNLHPAATDLFQFNYVESFESTEKRFNEWLESSVAIALAEWKRSLQV